LSALLVRRKGQRKLLTWLVWVGVVDLHEHIFLTITWWWTAWRRARCL